ncbi:hypothetical protein ADK58_12325, partial [Streptomyces sp. XY152]
MLDAVGTTALDDAAQMPDMAFMPQGTARGPKGPTAENIGPAWHPRRRILRSWGPPPWGAGPGSRAFQGARRKGSTASSTGDALSVG